MTDTLTLASLPPARERLVRLMQELNFGFVEGLVVRHGEPVFDPPPRVVHEIKFGGENGPRPEAAKEDFALKAQVRELVAQLEALGDAVVRRIEVKHGLPFKMTIEEDAA